MKKLDVYILKKFLKTYVFVVLILVFVISIIDFTEKNDDFLKHNLSGEIIWHYYLTFFPFIIGLLTPITVFIATVFVTAKMASQTEIIAILASGVSFRRLMLPYFIGATLIAIMSFYLNAYFIPDANKFRIDFEKDYVRKPFYFSDRNIHLKIGPSEYIYMDRYNNQRDQGYNVTLERIENNLLLEKLNAQTIRWDSTTQRWTLRRWQLRTLNPEGEDVRTGIEIDTALNVRPEDFDDKLSMWETLTLTELEEHIELQESRGAEDVIIYKIEKYIRFMMPFTVIILMFIGVIVSARKSRKGTGYQIALGFLISFIFIIFFVLSRALAEAHSMHPILAVWLPNITFTGVGLFMYRMVPR